MLHNKKAAVSETLTWVVATIIIMVILVFSIFVVSLLKVGKTFGDKKFEFDKGKDVFVTKSLYGYLLTKDNSGKIVFEQIGEEGDLNEFNGPLSINIFLRLYQKDYSRGIWLDVRGEGAELSAGSKRRKYYEGYYENLGEDWYNYALPTDFNVEERIYFEEIPDDVKVKNIEVKNLALFLRK